MYTCKWVFHPHISPSLPTAATFIVQNLHSLWIFVPSSRHHITTGTTMCGIAKSALSSGRKPQRQDNCQVSCHYLETLKINSRRIVFVVEQSHYRGGWVLLWPGRCPSGSVSWFGGRLDSDKEPRDTIGYLSVCNGTNGAPKWSEILRIICQNQCTSIYYTRPICERPKNFPYVWHANRNKFIKKSQKCYRYYEY